MTDKQIDKHIPRLRFPEFQCEGEWRMLKLRDVVSIVNDRSSVEDINIETYISTENMLPDFRGVKKATKLPTTGAFTRFKENDILFSNIRPYLKKVWRATFAGTVSNDILVFRTLADFDNCFVSQIIMSEEFISYTMVGAKGVKMPRGDKNMMLDYDVFIPPLPEQKKIAKTLSELDELIKASNKKIEQLKAHKKSLMQKLFPQNGKTVPEYRFPEFRDSEDWEKRILDDVTVVVNRRNKSNRHLPIYSISNNDGFVPQSEQFEGLDSKKRGYDISLYKIVGRNTFAYNPARINIGSIGYSGDLKEVLISSLYVCFKTTDELDDEFLRCFLNTSQFGQAVENNVEGGIRSYLFYENFSRIKISFPSIREQKKIASAIMSMEELIACCQKKALLLEDHKRGLMQLLFPSTK